MGLLAAAPGSPLPSLASPPSSPHMTQDYMYSGLFHVFLPLGMLSHIFIKPSPPPLKSRREIHKISQVTIRVKMVFPFLDALLAILIILLCLPILIRLAMLAMHSVLASTIAIISSLQVGREGISGAQKVLVLTSRHQGNQEC